MKKIYRRSISGLMALLICFTTILGGGITAFAASSSGEVAKSYSIGFPRSGDANLDYSGTWGHDELHYMNGWTSGEATWMTTLHTIGSFDGPACYCIEPGVPRLLEKTYTRYGEDYWKNYPSDYNSTIDADTIKTLLGRIMQYGYQGDLSLDWRSQNEADADKMAHMMATQVLVWETVVGERDANFNHVDPGSADAVKSMYRTSHPLYSRFSAYYDSIEASVQSHTVIPSFMSKAPNKAQTVELKWDGSQYTATLTDSNHVVSDYTFSSNLSNIVFTSNGDTLTITAKTAPTEPVTISASKNNIRKGVVVWSDGHYGPDGTMQDAVTYAATVMDPVQAFLNLKVSYGSAKIVKTSEDGKVDTHSYGSEWKNDADNHWHECSCGDKKDTAAHTAGEWIIDTPATATTDGSKHKECTVCGYTMATETIPATGGGEHTHSYGSEWKNDADNHWHECSCGDKKDTAAHTAGEWIIDTPATATTDGSKHKECTVCGYTMTIETIPATGGGEHTHSYGSDWKNDATNHWHECSCGDKADKAAHDFKWVVDKEATATQKGSKHEECRVCGYKKAAVEIPATGTPTEPGKPTDSDSPQTGDNSNMILWIALLFVSGGVVIGITVYSKKKKENAE